ncbi:MAG: ATP-binding protein [Myxococcales bacterium]|nr:MAG: ATP-binding protein [Myxococcales bacterium]
MTAEATPGLWLSLPFAPQSASEARRRFEEWLAAQADGSLCAAARDDDRRYDAQLVLSELIGNSVLHAAPLPDGTVQVGWVPGADGLDIAVRDGGGKAVPEVQDAPLMANGGRGLAIVAALARSWWVDRTTGQTTTHAVIA